MKFPIVFIFLFFPFIIVAQQSDSDSLNTIIKNTSNDSIKFTCYIQLFSLTSKTNINQAAIYLDSAKSISIGNSNVYYEGVYLCNKASYYYYKGLNDSGYATATRSYELLKQSPYKKALARSICNMSAGVGTQNAKSIRFLKQAQIIYEEIRDTTGLLYVYNNMSRNYTYLNLFDSALYFSNKALVLCRVKNDPPGMTNTYKQICNIYFEQESYDNAIEAGIKALEYATSAEDINSMIWLYVTIGSVYQKQEEDTKALEYYRLAMEKSLSSGFNKYLSRIYLEQADVFLKMKLYVEAENFYRRSLIQSKSVNNTYYEMAAQSGLSGLMIATYRYDSAQVFILNALKLSNELEAKTDMPSLYNRAGEVYYLRKDLNAAESYAIKSLKLSEELNDREKMSNSLKLLANISESRGNHKKALEYFKQHEALHDSLFNAKKTKIISEIENKYQSRIKQDEIDSLQYAGEIQSVKLQSKEREFYYQRIAGFVTLLFILIITMIWVYRYRQQKLFEKNQSLLKERLRISRDLHDDLGATLSSISIYSTSVKKMINENKLNESNLLLDRMSEDCQDMVTNISYMVWAMNPQNDNMEKLLDRLKNFAVNVLSAKDIYFHFKFDKEILSINLPMTDRKNIFLIFKEAINNAAKYSNCRDVTVSLQLINKKLIMEVADNGGGFNLKEIKEGNGLKNMNERAIDLNGVFDLKSSNEGTIISLSWTSP